MAQFGHRRIDFDSGYLFMGLTLMHLRQHDAEAAAAFAGPTVTLFNPHDVALYMDDNGGADLSAGRRSLGMVEELFLENQKPGAHAARANEQA